MELELNVIKHIFQSLCYSYFSNQKKALQNAIKKLDVIKMPEIIAYLVASIVSLVIINFNLKIDFP